MTEVPGKDGEQILSLSECYFLIRSSCFLSAGTAGRPDDQASQHASVFNWLYFHVTGLLFLRGVLARQW
jgi:hypothetical protein